MEIQYYGANCVKLSDKKIVFVVDDNLSQLGLKTITGPQDVAIYTTDDVSKGEGRFLINGPGEYEISEVSIRGVAAQAHIDKDGLKATIYSIKIDDFNICIVGHIDANLSDDQLEKIGVVDVLIIPIGGFGFTLDAAEVVSIIKKIEPKIVIPTHYADGAVKYEVPQADLELFLKAVGITEPEFSDSLILKERELSDKTRTIILKRLEAK